MGYPQIGTMFVVGGTIKKRRTKWQADLTIKKAQYSQQYSQLYWAYPGNHQAIAGTFSSIAGQYWSLSPRLPPRYTASLASILSTALNDSGTCDAIARNDSPCTCNAYTLCTMTACSSTIKTSLPSYRQFFHAALMQLWCVRRWYHVPTQQVRQ